MAVLVTCKFDEDPIKNDVAIFPIISLWELLVAVETRVFIQSAPKPYAAFPPPKCYKVHEAL